MQPKPQTGPEMDETDDWWASLSDEEREELEIALAEAERGETFSTDEVREHIFGLLDRLEAKRRAG